MKVLAFDTALGGCAVAVVDTETGQAVADVAAMTRGQSEVLVPAIQAVMDKSGWSFTDLDLIATTVGPGAFTGLRIGLSAARSFGLALDIPVDGVLTTECIAQDLINKNNKLNGDVLIVLETKREDFYTHLFSCNFKVLQDVSAFSRETTLAQYQDRTLIVCGDGAARLHSELGPSWPEHWTLVKGYDLPDPVTIAQIAATRRQSGQPLPPDPVYLRDADVSVSARPARTIAGQ